MKFEFLRKGALEKGFKLTRITFLEDGYEVRLKLIEAERDLYVISDEKMEEGIKRLDALDYKGFVVVETVIINNTCTLLLVPKSMEEMTEFVWKYVEKYGKKDDRLVDILANAFCVLEKVVESIPDELSEEKNEALKNYESFSSMVF